ncbi:MAG: hypothetical protein CYG60_18640 [Actinobacteria bacterium]|nr:MAG: hypothetical protein CYG60_18640 [Actinomycetota bacterium]
MSPSKNKGGSARDILSRGSRQVQQGAEQAQEVVPTTPAATPGRRAGGDAGGRREGTKRITVDLPRNEHKFLRDFAYDADSDGMRVVRALLMELRDNPELSARVVGRLAALQEGR